MSSFSTGAGPGLSVLRGVEVATTTTPEDDEHLKEEGVLSGRQQYGINNAILAGPVCYPGVSHFCLDDCTLGENVPSHVVQIGLVFLYGLNLHYLGLACDGISDCGHVATQHAHLYVSAFGLDLLNPDRGNGGVALLSADLTLSLTPGGNQFSPSGLPSKFALPTHILIPQIANPLWCTVFNGCGG